MFMAPANLAQAVPATELFGSGRRRGQVEARGVGRKVGPHARTRHGGRWPVWSPGSVGGWAPCGRRARGSGPSGSRVRLALGSVGRPLRSVQAAVGCHRRLVARWGRWGGVAVRRPSAWRASRQPPSVDGPVMGSADAAPGWSDRWAAMEPVAQVMRLRTRPGPRTVGEHTAAVADGQGGALGGLDDPGGAGRPPGVGWGAAQGRGNSAIGARSRPQPLAGQPIVGRGLTARGEVGVAMAVGAGG